jgi:hypothetical protein
MPELPLKSKEFLSGLGIPNLYLPAFRAGSHTLAIRAKGNIGTLLTVPLDRQ